MTNQIMLDTFELFSRYNIIENVIIMITMAVFALLPIVLIAKAAEKFLIWVKKNILR